MRYKDIKKSDHYASIPQEGYMMAVFDDLILFQPYQKTDDGLTFSNMENVSDRNLLRIHCFDRDTEYRRMELDDGDRIIEAVLSAEEETAMDPDLIYEDEMLLREEFIEGAGGLRALKVINRFRYTYFDTMTLDNYRLSYQE